MARRVEGQGIESQTLYSKTDLFTLHLAPSLVGGQSS